MRFDHLEQWRHTHAFGQDRKRPGEPRTIAVIAITAAMTVVEIATGFIFGSMALLADGLHMASHAVALTINAFAYIYARRHAYDTTYSFGTGKVNALGGFTGAVLLVVFAMMMAWESVKRLVYPVEIAFDQAILVAVLGLLVNGASVFILGHHDHPHGSDENTDHDRHRGADHNLRAAHLHVMADALTSLLAIFALLAAKYAGLIRMDPLMGIVGAVLVSRWSLGLLRDTSAVLLDKQGPERIQSRIKECIEDDQTWIADLHLWSIGPRIYALILSVVTRDPRPPEYYKELIPPDLGLVHVTVEVCESVGASSGQRTASQGSRTTFS
ncbi:MAG: CDF family Co(II)/Ni(II) efflux transporter DmeF [Planctomycetes bacterium]|nr:CDF family Co(II)/Ni(II) efflux transporter DmeF [Planctomycetota bacterium]